MRNGRRNFSSTISQVQFLKYNATSVTHFIMLEFKVGSVPCYGDPVCTGRFRYHVICRVTSHETSVLCFKRPDVFEQENYSSANADELKLKVCQADSTKNVAYRTCIMSLCLMINLENFHCHLHDRRWKFRSFL